MRVAISNAFRGLCNYYKRCNTSRNHQTTPATLSKPQIRANMNSDPQQYSSAPDQITDESPVSRARFPVAPKIENDLRAPENTWVESISVPRSLPIMPSIMCECWLGQEPHLEPPSFQHSFMDQAKARRTKIDDSMRMVDCLNLSTATYRLGAIRLTPSPPSESKGSACATLNNMLIKDGADSYNCNCDGDCVIADSEIWDHIRTCTGNSTSRQSTTSKLSENRSHVDRRKRKQSSENTRDGHGSKQPRKGGKEPGQPGGSNQSLPHPDFPCPFYQVDPITHVDCRNVLESNICKIKYTSIPTST